MNFGIQDTTSENNKEHLNTTVLKAPERYMMILHYTSCPLLFYLKFITIFRACSAIVEFQFQIQSRSEFCLYQLMALSEEKKRDYIVQCHTPVITLILH